MLRRLAILSNLGLFVALALSIIDNSGARNFGEFFQISLIAAALCPALPFAQGNHSKSRTFNL